MEQVSAKEVLCRFRGQVLTEVRVKKFDPEWMEQDTILLTFESGQRVLMTHMQECCEGVWLEDDGGVKSLVGGTLVNFEEVRGDTPINDFAYTGWTFYSISTSRGYATIRWQGESNGYYSVWAYLYVL